MSKRKSNFGLGTKAIYWSKIKLAVSSYTNYFHLFSDSGIQSVGDSIRGSSDSMSNGTNQNSQNNQNLEPKKFDLNQKSTSPNQQPVSSTNQFVPLVHKVFGGKLQTTYQCSNCKSISLHKESFTDLHLAFPEDKNEKDLTVQKLLNNYLTPENLEGENKYHCDHCNNLQVRMGISTVFIRK